MTTGSPATTASAAAMQNVSTVDASVKHADAASSRPTSSLAPARVRPPPRRGRPVPPARGPRRGAGRRPAAPAAGRAGSGGRGQRPRAGGAGPCRPRGGPPTPPAPRCSAAGWPTVRSSTGLGTTTTSSASPSSRMHWARCSETASTRAARPYTRAAVRRLRAVNGLWAADRPVSRVECSVTTNGTPVAAATSGSARAPA